MSGVETLPPKPDPDTGEPRPPHAPRYGSPAGTEGHDSKAAKPKPPPGFGPTLEWHVESRRSALLIAGLAVVLLLGVEFLFFGLSLVDHWVGWAIVLGTGVLLYLGFAGRTFAAGAEWLRSTGWVNTYRLQLIEMNVLQGSVSLTLQDDQGGALSIDIEDLQSHQKMWDLVYNGMRHSVAAGVTVKLNDYARSVLKLPSPHPSAEAKAKFAELRDARKLRKGPRSRRLPGLVLHLIGWPLLVIAAFTALMASGPDRADGIRGAIVLGLAGLAMIVAAFGLRRRRGGSGEQRFEIVQ
jgi:hypothetical protein